MITKIFQQFIKQETGLTVDTEFRFHEKRRWRVDFVIHEHKIAIELEGGIWKYGRHNRASGFIADMEKYNELTAHGWKLLRFNSENLLTKHTVDLIKRTIST